MNVTFSCKVLSRWAQLFSVFSRMFKFSRIVIYWAKSRRSGLEWGDLLLLFNRNNCSLSVGVFSFSPMWESIAVQFLTFVLHGEQTLVEKDYPSSRTTKSSFFSRSASFGNVSPFLVGAKNTLSELIHPLIKLQDFENEDMVVAVNAILQLRKEAWKKKKIRTSTGFEPVISRYRCDALPTELWSHWRWEQIGRLFVQLVQ